MKLRLVALAAALAGACTLPGEAAAATANECPSGRVAVQIYCTMGGTGTRCDVFVTVGTTFCTRLPDAIGE